MKKGFTLVEVMIVVAIIAILAAIAIPNFISYRKTSQKNSCLANLKALDGATEAFLMDNPSKADSVSIDDLWKSAGTGILKSKPTCPCSGTYSYSKDTQKWTCGYTDTDTAYSHVRPEDKTTAQ